MKTKAGYKIKASALIPLEVVEQAEVVTIEDLIDDYYIHHKWKQKELKKEYRGGEQYVVRPICVKKNPFGSGDVLHRDTWIAIYYRRYYIRVECGKSVVGPHKFELFWQLRIGEHIRLGVWQANFFFHNERKLRKKLKLAILKKKFYASEETLATVIDMTDPDTAIEV